MQFCNYPVADVWQGLNCLTEIALLVLGMSHKFGLGGKGSVDGDGEVDPGQGGKHRRDKGRCPSCSEGFQGLLSLDC